VRLSFIGNFAHPRGEEPLEPLKLPTPLFAFTMVVEFRSDPPKRRLCRDDSKF
jgi:hypothetical protein